MLWVWGDASPTAYIDSAATPAALLPEIDADDGLRGADGAEVLDIGKRYARDFNYSWSILVENVMDSSHVPFAHHGVLGSR
jgi:pheophorbide a oxygenase